MAPPDPDPAGEAGAPGLLWDLADGLAVMARGFGGHMEQKHRQALRPILERLRGHAAEGGHEAIAGRLKDALEHLERF